jgi:Arc/MetJ family transcription regulator
MYIDPGTGSIVLQALAASLLAFFASARRAREAVGRAFRRLLGRRGDNE